MDEIWVRTLPRLQVIDICDAYESGFGHGLQGRDLGNPYHEGSPGFIAYGFGWETGVTRRKEIIKPPPPPPPPPAGTPPPKIKPKTFRQTEKAQPQRPPTAETT